jgi:hypothetical protein
MNQGTAFTKLDQELNLDASERKTAEDLHQELTGHLIRRGLIVGAFLQGSFARKTMRRPLHDIDKILVLPPSQEALVRSRWGGPDVVMDALEPHIAELWPGTTFERLKHALRLHIPNQRFHFDAVPAFDIKDDVKGDVLIANREAPDLEGQWERSNSRQLIAVVGKRNGDCGAAFIHWVRMGKEMVAVCMGDRAIPGLHTESICFAANSKITDHATACLRLFETGAQLMGSGYTDPTGVDVLSDRLDQSVRLQAQAAFAGAARQAHEAMDYAAAGDDDNACRLWHAIFGDAFPVPRKQTAAEALVASFAGGGVSSLGTVTRTPVAPQTSRPTRAWTP